MLTIEIPEVNAQKSAEDELAGAILRALEKDGKCARVEYYHRGGRTGSWSCGGTGGHSSVEIIYAVARAFKDRGYIVNDKTYSGNFSDLFISR